MSPHFRFDDPVQQASRYTFDSLSFDCDHTLAPLDCVHMLAITHALQVAMSGPPPQLAFPDGPLR